jgi:hypothetical protein
MNETKVALALLRSRTEVERVITDLGAAGITPAEISVLQSDDGVLDDIAGDGAANGKPSALGSLTSLGSVLCAGIEHPIAAGPIRRVLDGSARRTVTGALRALGTTEQRATMYEGRIRDGAILIAVHTSEGKQVGEARRLLALHGGYEISVAVPSATAETFPN